MRNLSRGPWIVVWAAFALFLLAATQSPFHFHFTLEQLRVRAPQIMWSLSVVSPDGSWSRFLIQDDISNVLLFIPFGFFGYWSLGGSSGRKILRLVILGCLFSAAIEFTQLFTETRDTSLPDVINNTLGTALGAWFAARLFLWRRA